MIAVDTREKLPYEFDPARVSTVKCALPAGDYSVVGYETMIAAERKSLDDYVASVIHDRERFQRELAVLAGYPLACIVVESSLDDVAAHRYRSAAHPNSIFGATTAIMVDYALPVFFCDNRQLASRFVEDLLCRFHRKALECEPIN